MWTVIEPELAIICANMPLLETVLSRVAPSLFSTDRKGYGVSDPQTFERPQDPQMGNVYQMNQFDHEPIRTHMSTGIDVKPQRNVAERAANSSVTSRDVVDSYSNLSAPPPGTVNVTQVFGVQQRLWNSRSDRIHNLFSLF
ncbi:hypothetical protein N7454_001527 [Penicillium verhagenii]|nr:hypothetical protein N7454_001527 [Penicillium verhagenii]